MSPSCGGVDRDVVSAFPLEVQELLRELPSDLRRQLEAVRDSVLNSLGSGDDVSAWLDSARVDFLSPQKSTCAAASRLAAISTHEFTALLAQFSDPLACGALAFAIDWSADVGDAWVRTAESRPGCALGLARWVSELSKSYPRDPQPAWTPLAPLVEAVAARGRAEEVDLLWQLLASAFRLSSRQGQGVIPPPVADLYGEAARRLALNNGVDALPDTERLDHLLSRTPAAIAVLPFVAFYLEGERASPLLEVFFSRLAVQLGGEQSDIPRVVSHEGLLLADACGLAVTLKGGGAGRRLWREQLERELRRARRGNGGGVEAAAWLVCAACLGALSSQRDGNPAWRSLWDEVWTVARDHVSEWWWSMQVSEGSPAVAALPELLSSCAGLAGQSEVVVALARSAFDLRSLEAIQSKGSPAMTEPDRAEVARLAAERRDYERALGEEVP